jgi:oligopeptide transport system substrate-binding protein
MSGWNDPARRGRRPALLLACAALALLAGCAKPEEPGSARTRILRISQRNEPADLDPATASLPDELFIIRALSEGLVAPAPDHAPPVPAAAEYWEVSPDGLAYTFHLRGNARWSNGEPVTADDFVASYQRVLAPATAAPKAPLFFMVRNARAYATGRLADFSTVGFRALGPLTLLVTLEHPMPRFLAYAASGPWIPANPRVVAQFGRHWTRPGNFVGNGAFTLAEWRPHQRIVVRKNADYHAAARLQVDEIRFLAFDNGDAEERAFRAGQLDVTMAIPFSKLERYRQERPDEAHRAPLAETRYLSFNTTRPPLDDVRVRRALSLALDRTRLVDKVMRGGQEPAFRLVPAALRSPDDRDLPFAGAVTDSAATARELLADAGFPDGRGFPRLELSTWVGTAVCEAVQAMWKKELGIDVQLVTREAKVHLTALREGNYDIGFITAIPDVPDAANLLGDFTTGAPGNYPQWTDARYDLLMTGAERTTDAGRQAARLRDAETRLLGQCPLTPLYFNTTNWLMRSNVEGWHQDALWTRFYQDVYLDEKN